MTTTAETDTKHNQ